MLCTVEIRGRYPGESDRGNTLSPRLADRFSLTASRVYRIRGRGEPTGLEQFVRRVLVDPVAEVYRIDQPPMVDEYECRLDIRLKEGLRDPRRKAILDFQRGAPDRGFDLNDIVPLRRVYVRGSEGEASPSGVDVKRLLRDLVNPTVNEWSLDRAEPVRG